MKIEVCTNGEWWRMFGQLDFCDTDAAAMSVVGRLRDCIEDAGHTTVNAQGQRMLLHGWNGCNTFARKYGGIGTFDRCEDAEWEAVVNAYDGVVQDAAREAEREPQGDTP